ncbi:hypothetical protein HZH68_016784 [Vespula germanica]|uniref:Uncharacterized protein n=1 Tax=Vespula germanica TaxID=30212 RepID=A0A834J034_VESGE|nr:hypothetical protein HZH68_016784 [Vespula germanica]
MYDSNRTFTNFILFTRAIFQRSLTYPSPSLHHRHHHRRHHHHHHHHHHLHRCYRRRPRSSTILHITE